MISAAAELAAEPNTAEWIRGLVAIAVAAITVSVPALKLLLDQRRDQKIAAEKQELVELDRAEKQETTLAWLKHVADQNSSMFEQVGRVQADVSELKARLHVVEKVVA